MPELKQNVHVLDEESGEAKWYGPDYPENGDPPSGAVTNKAAYEDAGTETPPPEELTPREHLEAAADPTRAGVKGEGVDDSDDDKTRSRKSEGVESRGVRGEQTGDRSRTVEGVEARGGVFPAKQPPAPSQAPPARPDRQRG